MATPAATTVGTTTAPDIDEIWRDAQKWRGSIVRELEQVQGKEAPNEVARFEKIERLMEHYRLACIKAIWVDFRVTKEKHVEDTLWQAHTLVTKAYRKVLGRLNGNDHAVLRRRVERLYAAYLKTAQSFYKGWLKRVCARYSIKDLQRITRAIGIEMEVPEDDIVDAAAQKLDEIVRDSCHKTLIYLGDLARYRTLLRIRDRNWDNALSYYLLANDLAPESGYGHHQCGVIYKETDDHLHVVYHMYRAMVCDKPHPNAAANLDREFRDIQRKRGGDARQVFVIWFLKLHAFYCQGKEFSERKELENEVDHRLAVAMKSGTLFKTDQDLLQIILINITSYAACARKVQGKIVDIPPNRTQLNKTDQWTEERSRSCQYLLLLNIRTIYTISKLIRDELNELVKRQPVETTPAQEQSQYTPVFTRVLPFLRVYMAWLCFYSAELKQYQEHLEPQFGDMCKMLSMALGLIMEFVTTAKEKGQIVPWRFPEDELTLGLQCLNGPGLKGCQLYCDPFSKQPKPRRDEAPEGNYSDDDITFTRMLHIALCAFELATPGSPFPLIATTSTESDGYATVVYHEGPKPTPQSHHSPQPSSSAPTTAAGPTPPVVSSTPAQVPAELVAVPSPGDSVELSEDQEFYGERLRRASIIAKHSSSKSHSQPAATKTSASKPAEVQQISQPVQNSDFLPIENQLYNILNDFLSPPETRSAQKPETPTRLIPEDSTSYGMGSTTANDVFGAASSSPGLNPGSATNKTFPTLPWSYFYPVSAGSGMKNPGAGAGSNGWDNSISPRPASQGSPAHLAGSPGFNNPLAHHQHRSSASGSFSRDRVNQLQGYGRDPWQQTGGNLASQGRTASNPLSQQNIWGPSSSPFSGSYNLSANPSSLPSVNSPMGLPLRTSGLGHQQPGTMARSPLSANPLRAYPTGADGGYINPPPGFSVGQNAAAALADSVYTTSSQPSPSAHGHGNQTYGYQDAITEQQQQMLAMMRGSNGNTANKWNGFGADAKTTQTLPPGLQNQMYGGAFASPFGNPNNQGVRKAENLPKR
ncbi:hypothetical protein QBC40DRAFT_300010 [Triangularia verruculosa]|uniref:Nonsense-mediated mRNA decay factor n=1 Tax=Triangularia verruculosa TaxID=2587418 RepID=A0AAN6XA49_9PEZI|nr:hypothetical protein QBC40DRAFT_300010 [Triangularia verruculosa]